MNTPTTARVIAAGCAPRDRPAALPAHSIVLTVEAGDVYGYYAITRQYFDRYKMPVMHTETNRTAKYAVEWLWKEWMNLLRLREDGVPLVLRDESIGEILVQADELQHLLRARQDERPQLHVMPLDGGEAKAGATTPRAKKAAKTAA